MTSDHDRKLPQKGTLLAGEAHVGCSGSSHLPSLCLELHCLTPGMQRLAEESGTVVALCPPLTLLCRPLLLCMPNNHRDPMPFVLKTDQTHQ